MSIANNKSKFNFAKIEQTTIHSKYLLGISLMNRKLWEWETDTFFVECIIYSFVNIKQYAPIITCFDPDTDGNINAARI